MTFTKFIYPAALSFFAFLIPLSPHAYFEVKTIKEDAVMNGIKFKDHSDFTKKWKMVTIRFREDSKEIRITYANDLAWKTIHSLKPDFPDGAMFAKVALATEDDAAFVSSKVPSHSKRFQFMLKDKKKYKDTDGWGYALFSAEGERFSDDEKTATMACAACHRIVPERDYVFSRPYSFDFKGFTSPALRHVSPIRFELKDLASFQGEITKLAKAPDGIESLEGDIQKNGFSGTLDEIAPILLDRSKKIGRPAALWLNGENFTLVQKAAQRKDGTCIKENESRYQVFILFNGKTVRNSETCQ